MNDKEQNLAEIQNALLMLQSSEQQSMVDEDESRGNMSIVNEIMKDEISNAKIEFDS